MGSLLIRKHTSEIPPIVSGRPPGFVMQCERPLWYFGLYCVPNNNSCHGTSRKSWSISAPFRESKTFSFRFSSQNIYKKVYAHCTGWSYNNLFKQSCGGQANLSPVDLYLIFEKSSWKNQVWRTGFLVYFELDFYCLCGLQKSISNLIFAG